MVSVPKAFGMQQMECKSMQADFAGNIRTNLKVNNSRDTVRIAGQKDFDNF